MNDTTAKNSNPLHNAIKQDKKTNKRCEAVRSLGICVNNMIFTVINRDRTSHFGLDYLTSRLTEKDRKGFYLCSMWRMWVQKRGKQKEMKSVYQLTSKPSFARHDENWASLKAMKKKKKKKIWEVLYPIKLWVKFHFKHLVVIEAIPIVEKGSLENLLQKSIKRDWPRD